ncbi:MAG: hypothetical protein K5675_04865 [Lachnospiraceae bacterium]|nr:hypothetical protein [Lachnospiraceae bacterium]
MTEQLKMEALEVIQEAVNLLGNRRVSTEMASAAIRGTVTEIMAIYETEVQVKEERIQAMQSALKFADQQISGLQKDEPKKAPSDKVNKPKTSQKVPKPKKKETKTVSDIVNKPKKRTFKEKTCKKCGKTFTPHYGAQTLCEECKTNPDRLLEDIAKTAQELADML